ncbi:MAG: tRNA pseudouridine(38-40) synthase TruA, partial [Burkholderiaceae bacterium]|nr:tRNA pseudouridine(38-40) synthase TruA [Burkholderiaceae bacterium]
MNEPAVSTHRVALGLSYAGQRYNGWQSQASGNTVQDHLETALARFAATGCERLTTLCAGRTDAGVHGVMQVVHFDAPVQRPATAWVRGTNRFLPSDIAIQWAQSVPQSFHARASAIARRYAYLLLQSPVRPSVEAGRVGWVFRPLDGAAMAAAARILEGEHDFSSFRAAACQAHSPVKTLAPIHILRRGLPASRGGGSDSTSCYWRFEFEANAFLHHM